jgi:predicted aspartyl protease
MAAKVHETPRDFMKRIWSAIIAFSLAVPVAAWADCSPVTVAVAVGDARPVIEVMIDGHAAHMVLDTGASQIMLMPDAPDRLGLLLAGNHPPEQRMSYGRPFPVRFVRARRIVFAGATTTIDDLAVIDGGGREAGIDGFFTDARLQQADIDLAHGRIDLYCDGAPAWTQDPDAVSVPLEDRPRLFGPALVNGRPMRVLFDTGSPVSSMTLAAARTAGVPVGDTPGEGARGLGMDAPLRAWTAHLRELDLGGRVSRDVTIQVVDKPNASADMIAGFDFFRRHRVWIDKKNHRLVFQAASDF